MNIKRYCTKSGRMFLFPTTDGLLGIKYNDFNDTWLLQINTLVETDLSWEDLVEKIENIPGINQYI